MAYQDDQMTIALGRDEILFVVPENEMGVTAEPEADDAVFLTSEASFRQGYTYHENEERNGTRSQKERIPGRIPHGEFSFSCYIKPSGTPGVEPAGSSLFLGVFGSKEVSSEDTISDTPTPTTTRFAVSDGGSFKVGQAVLVNGEATFISAIDGDLLTVDPALSTPPAPQDKVGAGVHYRVAEDLPSFTIWAKKGHTVFTFVGCGFDELSLTVSGREPLSANFRGGFLRMMVTGSDELFSSIDAVSETIPVRDARKFEVGSIIKVDDEVMKVSGVDHQANELTVIRGYKGTTASSHDGGAKVTPYLPSPSSTGYPVNGKLGIARMDGAEFPILEGSITFRNSLRFLEEEKTGEEEATSFIPGERRIEGSIRIYFRKKDASFFYEARERIAKSLILPAGDEKGKIVLLHLPQFHLAFPEIRGGEEQVAELTLMPYADSGEEELSLHFL